MLSAPVIRQLFFDFFKNKNHAIVSSASIVIKNDPTLMFTNAGMNQFKEYFLGNNPAPHLRIADTQKCLRVSGKHNDLEEVGIDTYHHTMFEMLGNWSFGDYFKEEAIAWSWELLTDVYKIPKDRIYVSVFKGDEKENLLPDEEAKKIWEKYVSADRILGFGKKDNFWEMGETGPCGPCSEIHIDCRSDEERKKIDGKKLVNADDPLVIEIWNNVFIQYNRMKDGSLQLLPQKHVDTGMGFERLVRVIQNKTSNYDTDIFSATFEKITSLTKIPYTGTQQFQDIAFRVIADHIRAICFCIADGQLPSNTGAGYVIRRILRRAVRYAYSHLQYQEALLYQLVPVIATQFETVFPELIQQQDFVTKIIEDEEQNFLRTISSGIKKLDTYCLTTTSKEMKGSVAFELYDTFGFPLDLTTMIASEKGFTVNEKEFEQCMQEQKNRSREATKLETFDWIILQEKKSKTPFVGYDVIENETSLLQYRTVQHKGKTLYQWVLLETPFYAESGGQVGDKGVLIFGEEQIQVVDTKKENDLIIHFTTTLPQQITPQIKAKVDVSIRTQTSLHHSATHLLHAALKKQLGEHVQQKGAFLCDTYLRFDFAHTEKIPEHVLQQIEDDINEKIQQDIAIQTFVLPKEEAIAKGANALFGEKYGDVVRMVVIDEQFSLELCGGTHAKTTKDIGRFKVMQESSVASGVRRIEAICGEAMNAFMMQQFSTLKAIKQVLQNPKDIVKSIENLVQEKQTLQQQLEDTETESANAVVQQILVQTKQQNGFAWLIQECTTNNANVFKKIPFVVKQKLQTPYCLCVQTVIDDKVHVAIQIDDETATTKNIDLNAWAKNSLFSILQGKGGGQKKSIVAVGENKNGFQQIVKNLQEYLS